MQVEDNLWVTLRYRLYDSQGEELEPDERELTYLHGGYGALFPRIEAALAGHTKGDRLSLYLEPEDTFGDYDAQHVRLADRVNFPSDVEPGMSFEGVPGEPPDGEIYTVTDVTDEVVVLDANHPLAGMALRFEIEIEDIVPATPEEIAEERARRDASPGGTMRARLH